MRIDKKDILYFALFGAIGIGTCQFAYLFAISRINVAAAILLQYLAPSFIVVYSVIFAKDRLNKPTVFALFGAIVGCYLVVGAYNLQFLALNLAGVLSGLLSAITFAWYSIHGEYGMRRYDPWTVLFYAMLFAGLIWNIIQPPFKAFFHPHTVMEWVLILYVGIMGTLIPFGLYFNGVNLIRSTRASITATFEPITAGFVSFFFLGEVLEPLQITGGILVIMSIIILQMRQEYDKNTPALLRAENKEQRPDKTHRIFP